MADPAGRKDRTDQVRVLSAYTEINKRTFDLTFCRNELLGLRCGNMISMLQTLDPRRMEQLEQTSARSLLASRSSNPRGESTRSTYSFEQDS